MGAPLMHGSESRAAPDDADGEAAESSFQALTAAAMKRARRFPLSDSSAPQYKVIELALRRI